MEFGNMGQVIFDSFNIRLKLRNISCTPIRNRTDGVTSWVTNTVNQQILE